MSEVRQAFEQWFKTTAYYGAYFTETDLHLNHRSQYENDLIDAAWRAWQERQKVIDELTFKAEMLRDEKNYAINRWTTVCKERDEQRQFNVALNSETIKQREQIRHLLEQTQEIANLKNLIKGHELRHEQNLGIKKNLTERVNEQQKRIDAAIRHLDELDKQLLDNPMAQSLSEQVFKALRGGS